MSLYTWSNPMCTESIWRGKYSLCFPSGKSWMSYPDPYQINDYEINEDPTPSGVESVASVAECIPLANFEYADEEEASADWFEDTGSNAVYLYARTGLMNVDLTEHRYMGFMARTDKRPAPLEISFADVDGAPCLITISIQPGDWRQYMFYLPSAYSLKFGWFDWNHMTNISFQVYHDEPTYIDDVCFFAAEPKLEYQRWKRVDPGDIGIGRASRVQAYPIAGIGEAVTGEASDLLEGTVKFFGTPGLLDWKFYDRMCNGTYSYLIRSPNFWFIAHPRDVNVEIGETYKGIRGTIMLNFTEDASKCLPLFQD